MFEHFCFFVAFSFILVHEMDAIRCEEWKLFPFLATLSNNGGYVAFTALHVPLYLLLLWSLWTPDRGMNTSIVMGLDVFFIIHLGLHLLFIKHRDNRFTSPFSWALILGAGLAGGLDLLGANGGTPGDWSMMLTRVAIR